MEAGNYHSFDKIQRVVKEDANDHVSVFWRWVSRKQILDSDNKISILMLKIIITVPIYLFTFTFIINNVIVGAHSNDTTYA